MNDINVKTIELGEYFNFLEDKEVFAIQFIDGYFEIQFDRGYIRCMAEATFYKDKGVHVFPSGETILMLYQLIGENIAEMSETDKLVTIQIADDYRITLDKFMAPPGDCCHVKVENLSRLLI